MTVNALRPEAHRVSVLTESIIGIYQTADQKLALVDTLIASDAGKRLNASDAAHGFNRLLFTVYLDVIKDLWAITRDTDSKAPSLTKLKKLLGSAGTVDALRAAYSKPGDVVFVSAMDLADVKQIHAQHHEREYVAKFDLYFEGVRIEIDNVLQDGRLLKLEQVRHQVVSHYSIEEAPGSAPGLVQIDKFNVYWHDAEEIFDLLDPLLTKAALIFTGKHYESVRFKGQHREWMRRFWTAMRKLGPDEGKPDPRSEWSR